jgi:hypothetical protein
MRGHVKVNGPDDELVHRQYEDNTVDNEGIARAAPSDIHAV